MCQKNIQLIRAAAKRPKPCKQRLPAFLAPKSGVNQKITLVFFSLDQVTVEFPQRILRQFHTDPPDSICHLFYKGFPLDVALLRGTVADEDGNITFDHESVMNEGLSVAMAAKNTGGIVIVQVEYLAQRGTLDPKKVQIPGIMVDYVVQATEKECCWQTEGVYYEPAFSGQIKKPLDQLPVLDLSPRKVICRRCAKELAPGSICNLGVGIPADVASIVAEEGQLDKITITAEVVNYPGVEKTSGAALTETMRKQAEGFGAEFLLAEVTGLDLSGDVKTVRTSRGDLKCFGVLLATGAHPRMVGFQGEEQFRGRGVAYCATCDGEFFTGKDVFVVGGGFAAAEESVFLTKYARHVTILIRGDDFSCAQATADAARNHEKITVLPNTEVEEVSGDTALRFLRYRNAKTGQVTKYHAAEGETFGVFVFAGYEPATELVRGLAERNEQGYVLTDRNQKTTADGLYAAGDVCGSIEEKDGKQYGMGFDAAMNFGYIMAETVASEIA